MITVLGITGSLHWPSHTHTLMEIALGAARDSGSRVELLDLRTLQLPMFEPGAIPVPPEVTEFRERAADAHAFIIGTPEYHGSLNGALKNTLDYLFSEVVGKLFGFVVSTGADTGATALSHLSEIISYMHAWSLPYGVSASLADFDESGHLMNTRVRERLQCLGRDVTIYGEMVRDRFVRDCVPDAGVTRGFASWHTPK